MPSIEKCAWCGVKFEPNQRQVGQKLRGRKLYCSPECCMNRERDRRAKWWRSDEGREYARNRARAKADTKRGDK